MLPMKHKKQGIKLHRAIALQFPSMRLTKNMEARKRVHKKPKTKDIDKPTMNLPLILRGVISVIKI